MKIRKLVSMIMAIVMVMSIMIVAVPSTSAASTEDLVVSATPTSGKSGNITWKIKNDTLYLTGTGEMLNYSNYPTAPWGKYSYDIKSVNIASTITSIGDYAFYSFSKLTSVTMGNNITKIGKYSFAYCDSLVSFTIPDSVKLIEEYAFYETALTSITSNAPAEIKERAFAYCNKLTSFNMPKAKSAAGYTFSYCNNLKTSHLGNAKLASYAISMSNAIQSVTAGSLDEYALYGLTSLQKVTLNGSVIGNYAFYNCKNLKTITSKAKVVGEWAFRYCDALTTVNLPYCVTVGKYAFYNNKNLQTVNFGKVQNINEYAFQECPKLKIVTGTNNLRRVMDGAFSMDSNLQSFGSPKKLTYIGYSAFGNCKKMNGGFGFSNTTFVGDMAFANCQSLTATLNFTKVNKIGSSAFVNCRNVKCNTLGVKLIELGSKAFVGCSKINQVYIPSCCKKFGYDIFPKKISSISVSSYGFMTYNYYTNGPKIAICGVKNSDAQKYAKLYKSRFRYAVTSIKTNRNSYSVKRGKTAKIGIYVYPNYASNRSVTLSTSNKNIATVNSKGYIKGIRKGRCTITIKSKDGSLKIKRINVIVK